MLGLLGPGGPGSSSSSLPGPPQSGPWGLSFNTLYFQLANFTRLTHLHGFQFDFLDQLAFRFPISFPTRLRWRNLCPLLLPGLLAAAWPSWRSQPAWPSWRSRPAWRWRPRPPWRPSRPPSWRRSGPYPLLSFSPGWPLCVAPLLVLPPLQLSLLQGLLQ